MLNSVNKYAKEYILMGTKGVGIIVIHGFTSSPSYMKWVCQDLNNIGFTVLAPLLPGHGTSEKDLANYDENDWYEGACSALARLRAIGVKKVFAVGHSLGGVLSLRLAEDGLVDGVVTIAAPIVLRGYVRARLFSMAGKKVFHRLNKPDGREGMYRYFRADGLSTKHLLRAIRCTKEGLCKVTVPAYIVYSKEDKSVHPESVQIIYSRILSKVKVVQEINGNHHCCIINSRDQYISKIGEFIEENA